MKNKKIKNLHQEIPARIRLQVYKKALKIYEDDKSFANLSKNAGLCLLLPCVLWDLVSFIDKSPSGEDWYCSEVLYAFTEFKSHHLEKINLTVDKKELRIKLLKRWIKKLEKDETLRTKRQ